MEKINTSQFGVFVQQIGDIQLFQGDTVTIPFQFIDYGNTPIPLKKSNTDKTYIEWRLCPYGQPQSPVLELKSTSSNLNTDEIYIAPESNIVYVNLDASRTNGLIYGEYMQQIILHYDFGDGSATKDFLRAQGVIIFREKIQDYF